LNRLRFEVNAKIREGGGLSGLRERQKADRHRRILAAAVTRFPPRRVPCGADGGRGEDAEVSVGTVYNYARTKGDLLMATVTLEVEEVLAGGEAILADPPAEAAEALLTLVAHYYDHSLSYLTKAHVARRHGPVGRGAGHARGAALRRARRAPRGAGHGALRAPPGPRLLDAALDPGLWARWPSPRSTPCSSSS
jgi:hypothetical protein